MRTALGHHESRRTIPILATVGLIAGMLSLSASEAGATTCLAKDGTASNSNLQAIIDGANTGDKIVIKGVCVGNFSVPGAGSAVSLTLKGKKTATLDGNHSDTVLSVSPSETVTLQDLVITNGNALSGIGGGIYNDQGTVNLNRHMLVKGNTANSGAGIYNYRGTVYLSGNTQVNDNTANFYGGGVFNNGSMTVSRGARVVGNKAGSDGGGIFTDDATLTMSGNARVNGNTANGDGGGIFVAASIVRLSRNTQVNWNIAGNDGGGVDNANGTVSLSGYTQVNGNAALSGDGGGIFNGVVNDPGTVSIVGDAEVNWNRAGNDGGGIWNDGALTGAIAGLNVMSNIPDDIAP